MIAKYISATAIALAATLSLSAQSTPELIKANEAEEKRLSETIDALREGTDSLRLRYIMERIEEIGLPGNDGEIVKHSAMALAYDEEHEMARWVMHMVIKEVADGRTSRTNDFRTDPKVSTGSSEEIDYFTKEVGDDGKMKYDGYGYDRGHLAASADFRWNQSALSESYFYSNMTPQRPEFNRESWAEVENFVRGYAIENNTDIFVVTGPVLSEDLPKVERSPNGMSLPEYHYKVAFDPVNERAVGFLMPNQRCDGPSESYIKTIDEIEEATGLDFFPNLDPETAERIEGGIDYKPWLPEDQRGDAMMLDAKKLEKGDFNTLQAYNFVDDRKKVNICGTVVSTFKSAKGNIFINLDKRFPNTVFTVNIWSRDVANFSYNPEVDLEDKRICVYGNVTLRDGIPQMNAGNEKQIRFLDNP